MKDPIQQALVKEFSSLPSWEDRYKRIIEMGKALPELPEKFKTEDLKVKGCQSQVWLVANLENATGASHETDKAESESAEQPVRKVIEFQADSDALIVKGLIAILLKVYSGRTPKEILEIQPDFIAELGFGSNLSPSRANGLQAMVKQIKYYALAFSYK